LVEPQSPQHFLAEAFLPCQRFSPRAKVARLLDAFSCCCSAWDRNPNSEPRFRFAKMSGRCSIQSGCNAGTCHGNRYAGRCVQASARQEPDIDLSPLTRDSLAAHHPHRCCGKESSLRLTPPPRRWEPRRVRFTKGFRGTRGSSRGLRRHA